MSRQLTIVAAPQLGVIRVQGEDALTFLQGQSTPDLRKLGPSQSVFGAFCNAQGRVIANGWFQAVEDGFRLVISRSLAPSLIKRLRMYVLRAKVVISDESDEAPVWLTQAIQPELAPEWIIDGPMGVTLFAAHPASFVDEPLILRGEAFGLMLIRAGIPLITPETSERHIPHMLSMDVLGGLSFDKGCYTGQEIVTRTQFLGKVKRTLHRLATDQDFQPTLDSPVRGHSGEESVGEVIAWAQLPGGGATGLAVIRNEAAEQAVLEIEGHRVEVSPVTGN